MAQIEVGDKVRDIVSGQEGIVVGVTKWLTGCDSATIEVPFGPDGTKRDNLYSDVNRLEVVKARAVVINQEPEPAKVGGPHDHGAPSRAVYQR